VKSPTHGITNLGSRTDAGGSHSKFHTARSGNGVVADLPLTIDGDGTFDVERGTGCDGTILELHADFHAATMGGGASEGTLREAIIHLGGVRAGEICPER